MDFVDSFLPSPPPQRITPPLAIILHQTGDTDLDKIIKYYTTNDQHVAPHFMIETTGSIRRFVPEDRIAYHAKIDHAEAQLYRLGFNTWAQWVWDEKKGEPVHVNELPQPNYNMWRDRWLSRGFQSPLELVTQDRPNAISLGIEIQNPGAKLPEFFYPEQYAAASALVAELCGRWRIPCDRDHILVHSDTSPMRRCSKAGPWDPPASFSFNRLWDGMRAPAR